MEEGNEIAVAAAPRLSELCKSLVMTGQALVEGIEPLSLQTVRDLQLLTLGAQFRGGQNTLIGQTATAEIFSLIENLVQSRLSQKDTQRLELVNDSGRTVVVRFSSDPDIAITEELPSGVRPLVSVEIKGGTDVSNVHNRIGEAEKSHQKAKNRGYFEFWTILGADVDSAMAKRESPTTTRFFSLRQLRNKRTKDYRGFRDQVHSVVGIRGA